MIADVNVVRAALEAVWVKHNLRHGWTALDEPGIVPDIIAAVTSGLTALGEPIWPEKVP